MIKANELRIGNLFYYNGDEYIIDGIHHYEIKLKAINEIKIVFVKISDLKPIPLTEEWLIKFGFNNDCEEYFISAKRSEFRPLKIRLLFSKEGYYLVKKAFIVLFGMKNKKPYYLKRKNITSTNYKTYTLLLQTKNEQ